MFANKSTRELELLNGKLFDIHCKGQFSDTKPEERQASDRARETRKQVVAELNRRK